jgi:hypothetical protein
MDKVASRSTVSLELLYQMMELRTTGVEEL